MDAFLHSTFLIAFAEMGDKTQLLAIILAARYRKPWLIVCGILLATSLNHAIASWLGATVGVSVDGPVVQWALALSFIAIGLWVLVPDTMEDKKPKRDYGAFATTCITFFIAEIGDKTQIATIALAAEYKQFFFVLLGTTTGMLIANVPAVFFGQKLLEKIPMKMLQYIASAMYLVFGVYGVWRLAVAG